MTTKSAPELVTLINLDGAHTTPVDVNLTGIWNLRRVPGVVLSAIWPEYQG